MTHGRDIQPALNRLDAALEAACASLVALESTRIGMRDEGRDAPAAQDQIGDAIVALRQAIAHLRALDDCDSSMLAFGFVLPAGPEFGRARARRC
jgi:hypothetical protein